VVVVDVPVDVAVSRLVEFRGMTKEDALARIEKQATRDERRAIADQVIDNSGELTALSDQVESVWQWALSLPPAGDDAGDRVPTA
jgi:dephospho-CoA kinase